jgi:NTE family protein
MLQMNITLALSGGGVKGFAHIGSLRVLEAEGFRIRGVAGTSAGGLVGALYAAGYSPDEMEARLRDIDQGNLFSRMHCDGPALLGLAGVSAILSDLLGERTFDDLRLPLAVTATDLISGLPVIIKQGRLIDAVLATSAVPGVFPTKSIGEHLLVDGGVMNPIPVAEARALYPDGPVVAVVLSPPLGWQKDANYQFAESVPVLMTNLPLVYRLAGRLRLTQAFNIFIHSMDLSGLMLMDKQLKLEQPEVIIRPNLGPIGIIDRVDIPAVIKSGEVATRVAIPDIRKSVSWQNGIKRSVSRLMSRSRGTHDEP